VDIQIAVCNISFFVIAGMFTAPKLAEREAQPMSGTRKSTDEGEKARAKDKSRPMLEGVMNGRQRSQTQHDEAYYTTESSLATKVLAEEERRRG
jgi:hypothetical protein